MGRRKICQRTPTFHPGTDDIDTVHTLSVARECIVGVLQINGVLLSGATDKEKRSWLIYI